ncbi:MAG TPA: CoA transferase [Mycobacteriales bacterium]|nr:CoA transferase [Mycobacteriales bacterium]
MTQICAGVNVLEMGAGSIAASMTGMVLADAGARVIKVEPPQGDLLRTLRPSGSLVWNRGKESLVADLRTPAGQQRLRELASGADVMISAFSPGRADQWGLGADAMCALNPALVHLDISGFGPIGPYARIKGYDSQVAAKVGLFARGAFSHREGPIFYPAPWASFGSAMQSVAGVLAALLVRDRTGIGQQLRSTLVAGLDPADYFMTTVFQLAAKRGETSGADPRSHLAASRYGVLVCTRDGRFVQTSTMLPHQAMALSEVAGITGQMRDPKFARCPMFDTAEDAQEWEDLLWNAFREQDLEYWLPRLHASPNVAFEIAVTSEEGTCHPQIVHNGDVVTVSDPVLGPVREIGPIGHFAKTPCVIERSAPALDQHGGPFTPAPVADVSGAVPPHPLSGVTIVEFGYFYAMPYGLTMAAALGARVIKIEDNNGDPHRMAFGENVASTKTTAGKESISIDLRSEQGQEAARKLVASADVFVTGFRSGIAERLGLGYEQMAALNPRLVYIHAAGYGTDGPYAHRALYAQAAQAVAGSFGRQVWEWAAPERNAGMSVLEMQLIVQPRLNQVVDGDSNAALALLPALVLGVFHQRRTGEGQFVRTSMIAGNAWAYSDDFCTYEGKPPVRLCDDDYYGTDALDRVYETRDGWVCLTAYTEREWSSLVTALGRPQLAADERFRTRADRLAHDQELIAALAERFATRTASEWEEALCAVDVGCVVPDRNGQPVFTSTDPVLRETGLTISYDDPQFGELVRAAPSVWFSRTPGRVANPSVRGEHNRLVLAELGYSTDELDRLEKDSVIFPPSQDG